MLLAIDTATKNTSVAISMGTHTAARNLADVNPGDLLAATVDELLRNADISRSELTAIAVGVGPGPFTSTRVGIATANAIGLALRIPVIGVCSHDAIGVAHPHAGKVIVATDARRREIYWAGYEDGVRIAGPTVGSPAEIIAEFGDARWLGDGLARYPDLAAQVDWQLEFPSADALAAIVANASVDVATQLAPELVEHGTAISREALVGKTFFAPTPLYLRRPDAKPQIGRR